MVVAINAFPTDDPEEWEVMRREALSAGAEDAVVSRHWEHGGEGAAALAAAVEKACEAPSRFHPLYELNIPVKEKIDILAREVYGAGKVEYSAAAEQKIAGYTEMDTVTFPSVWLRPSTPCPIIPPGRIHLPRVISSRYRTSG